MNQQSIISMLSDITIGTIIAWVGVIAAIITAIGATAVKIYKVFDKARDLKDENDAFLKMVKLHDEQLNTINDALKDIQRKLERNRKTEFVKLRHSIIRDAEEYVSKGNITIRQLRSLEEMYGEYHDDMHGNSYVTTLMKKVRVLPVIGRLNDKFEDITDDINDINIEE